MRKSETNPLKPETKLLKGETNLLKTETKVRKGESGAAGAGCIAATAYTMVITCINRAKVVETRLTILRREKNNMFVYSIIQTLQASVGRHDTTIKMTFKA